MFTLQYLEGKKQTLIAFFPAPPLHYVKQEDHARMEGTGISKVIGLSKLKTKYESHESKRQLCQSYDIFLADDRILPSLPKLLGKSFFKKKKQPVPVAVREGGDWGKEVRKALSGTFYFHTGGTSLNVKVARSGQGQGDIVENIMAAAEAVCDLVPKKWANVQGLFLKTAESVSLPIFQSAPEAAQRIDGAGSRAKKGGVKGPAKGKGKAQQQQQEEDVEGDDE
jgi:ribosome biogenesis protein UTP30